MSPNRTRIFPLSDKSQKFTLTFGVIGSVTCEGIIRNVLMYICPSSFGYCSDKTKNCSDNQKHLNSHFQGHVEHHVGLALRPCELHDCLCQPRGFLIFECPVDCDWLNYYPIAYSAAIMSFF